MDMNYEYYDGLRGWTDTKPGWHECVLPVLNLDTHLEKYIDIIEWLYSNVAKCERHTRWCITGDTTASFKFRYEKDYILFTLRWS